MVRGGGCGSGGPTGHMIYVLYCLYSTLVGWWGGRVGRKQYLTIEVFQYMFLLYYFIKAMGWGGGEQI